MSDEQKDNLKVDNWTQNAEEHGRMGAQLATLTTLVEVLTRTSEKLEDGQKEVRAELISQTNETNKRIDEANKRTDEANKRTDEANKRTDETNKRIEELKTFVMSQFSLFRKEFQDKSDKQSKEFQDKNDKQSKEIRTEMRWLIGAMIAIMGLAFTAMGVMINN